jgi:phosphoglucomutase
MALSALAGKPAPAELLIDVQKLRDAYYSNRPDPGDPLQLVSFGTSGHRGTSLDSTFTEAHILAITQAICEYRTAQSIEGPLFLGADTHALSEDAQRTALEVLAANGITSILEPGGEPVPTPAVSRAILAYNQGRRSGLADGVIITPSHNPPQDGGFKYNPPEGGPADTSITTAIQDRANEILRNGNSEVRRIDYDRAANASTTKYQSYILDYVRDLAAVIDMAAIKSAGLRIGADPLGGASLPYWAPIAEVYGLDITVVNPSTDPTFGFMTVDHDGKIRMDCSSPYAMAGLVGLKDKFDISFGNDPDSDRHGIVTRSSGLLNPNHYLAVAIDYLLRNRPDWTESCRVGKTLVSSGIIDRVVASAGRVLCEVPVGFKWFSPGLHSGEFVFGGEESAGASFLRRNGTVWTTDKDGIILNLLAAEITARTGRDPGEHYRSLEARHGRSFYTRIDTPATPELKSKLSKLSPESVSATHLAGDLITAKLTKAPGNGAGIGGLKVATENGWFAARPSGTENIYKLYAESFGGEEHLARIVADARDMIAATL